MKKEFTKKTLAGGGRLLSQAQAADLLSVSTETVSRWIRGGLLPAVRLPGRLVRIRLADLEKIAKGGVRVMQTGERKHDAN
jgi:excisionase family DNA binding protein